MRVITVSAKAQHGKDTFANAFKAQMEEKGKSVLIIHYADYLKFICETYLGWNGIKDEAGRQLLQDIGTDLIRSKYPDFWVDIVKNLLLALDGKFDYAIIPDTRFPNEIDSMKETFDFASVRLTRKNFDNGLTEAQKQHASETALDGAHFDVVFDCADGVENVEEAVHIFIRLLGE